jgi:hypothetical protein
MKNEMRLMELITALAESDTIETDSHQSDLYVLVTEESTDMMEKYGFIVDAEYRGWLSVFRDNIDNNLWYELPLVFDTYMEIKNKMEEQSEV